MGKKKEDNEKRTYWLTMNFYRWEFLRRSEEYGKFYKSIRNEYLLPLRKFKADMAKEGLPIDQIVGGSSWSHVSRFLGEQRRNLQNANDALSKEAYKFGLSWRLVKKHYPEEMLNPRKKLKNLSHVVFTDYQRFSPFYQEFWFRPHIKRIFEYLDLRDFEVMQRQGYVFFAINTWGEELHKEDFIEIATFIEKALQESKAPFVKNVFLLDPGEPLTGKQLKLLGTKLVQHWKNLLDIWDAFQRTRKKEKYEDALETVANRPGKSVKAVSTIKKALTQTHSLISEVAKGRFYTPSSI